MKAIGKMQPNPKQNIVLSNGAVVPCGEVLAAYDLMVDPNQNRIKGRKVMKQKATKAFGNQPVGNVGNIVEDMENPIPTQEYNEFVVYDASQVRIRYVVQVNLQSSIE